MRLSVRPRRRARIELVPLIDTVFLLLVFFIYAMLTMTVHRSVKVDLPKAGNPEPQLKEHVVITINEQGALFVNREPVEEKNLVEAVEAALGVSRYRIVVIDGDRKAALGQGVRILERLSHIDDVRVAFSVEAEGAGE